MFSSFNAQITFDEDENLSKLGAPSFPSLSPISINGDHSITSTSSSKSLKYTQTTKRQPLSPYDRPRTKQPFIQNKSFVGLTSRSKNGCINCRQKKKKCDEVFPACGLCQKKNLECVRRDLPQSKYKNQFDLSALKQSHKLIELEKHKTKQNNTLRSQTESNRINKRDINGKKSTATKQQAVVSEVIFVNTIAENGILESKKHVQPVTTTTSTVASTSSFFSSSTSTNVTTPISRTIEDALAMQLTASPFTPSSEILSSSVSLDNKTKTSPPILDNVDSNADIDGIVLNLIEHLHSPRFNPQTSMIDSMINNAIITRHNHRQHLRTTSSSSFPKIEELKDDVLDLDHIPQVAFFDTICVNNYDDHIKHEDDDYLPMDESQLVENLNLSDPELFSILKSRELINYLKPALHILFESFSTPSVIVPSSNLIRNLDDTGKLFLDHYISYIVDVITVCNRNESNFFLNYFLRLANIDEAVLMGIVAWGGMFLLGPQDESARKYFYKALNMVNERLTKKITFNNQEYMIILSSYIVMMGSEISTGDVKYWYHLFLQFKDVLMDYGGLTKFFRHNRHTNEGKWIISNFFYHDVMSTTALSSGTHLDMEEYKEIFVSQRLLELDNYGLDPFQGPSHGLFLIFGDVINKRRELKNLRMRIDLLQMNLDEANKELQNRALSTKILSPSTLSSLSSPFSAMENSPHQRKLVYEPEIEKLKSSHNKLLIEAFTDLDYQVTYAQPSTSQLDELRNQPALLELHLTTFELIQLTIQLYIRVSFRTTDFRSPEIQSLRINASKLFDILVGTHLQSSLTLPMMVIGVLSVDKEPREEMKQRYHKFISVYEVKNIRRCYDIITQCWKVLDTKDSNGEVCYVDWCDVIEDIGWIFCCS